MSELIKKGSRRPTSSADKRKAAMSFKKFDRSAAGQKYKRIMANPALKLKHLRTVTLPKYITWLKSAQKAVKTATGEEKQVLTRKIEMHKKRIKLARENIKKTQAAIKNANKPVKPTDAAKGKKTAPAMKVAKPVKPTAAKKA